MHAVGTDRFGQARRSAALVLALAVLVGSCGVAASVAATFGVPTGTVALLVVVSAGSTLALRAWRSAFARPLVAADDRALVAVGAQDLRQARNTAS
jgi:protein-S-isoprenylcysteine O-methyltransferase Ste14